MLPWKVNSWLGLSAESETCPLWYIPYIHVTINGIVDMGCDLYFETFFHSDGGVRYTPCFPVRHRYHIWYGPKKSLKT